MPSCLRVDRVKLAEREAAEAAFRRSRKPSALKGSGGGGGGEVLAVEQSDAGETAPRAAPTEDQVNQIRVAISAASSLEEVQRLERALKAGDYETIAKAAAAAQAAAGDSEAGAGAPS